jgi:hypothetical protein
MGEPSANAAPSNSDHYRDMARKIRELARQFDFAGTRQELLDLVLRYEQKAHSLAARSAASDQDHH